MKTRIVTVGQNGIIYNDDTGNMVLCWQHAADDYYDDDSDMKHPCTTDCAALDVDNVNGPRCLMMPHLMSFGLWPKKEG